MIVRLVTARGERDYPLAPVDLTYFRRHFGVEFDEATANPEHLCYLAWRSAVRFDGDARPFEQWCADEIEPLPEDAVVEDDDEDDDEE